MAARFPGGDWTTGPLPEATDTRTIDTVTAAMFSPAGPYGQTLALLAVQGGRVVHEQYGDGSGPDETHISWSMAKSITHALVGIAVGDGLLRTGDDNLFPEWSGDGRAAITVQHLLNMSSGLEWVEDYVDDAVSDVIEMLFGENDGDTAAYAASKLLGNEPGSLYCYSSGTTNLVTRILARALGEVPPSSDVMDGFIRSRLLDRIGMRSATPKYDKVGNFVGSSYVFATARDFARFGWLYLNDGMWDGERILPEGWVDHGRTYVATDPENGVGYGAHWWLDARVPGSMAAFGFEGQNIWVDFDRDLVVVRLGKTPAELGPALRQGLIDIVNAFPAVRSHPAPVPFRPGAAGADKSGGDV